jgi:hypothetical protein
MVGDAARAEKFGASMRDLPRDGGTVLVSHGRALALPVAGAVASGAVTMLAGFTIGNSSTKCDLKIRRQIA